MKRFMNKFIVALCISPILIAQNAPGTSAGNAQQHEFTISDFRTEGGVTLPQARIVYGTYGKLNEAKDNVVLLPSHYMANFHGYEWLIGDEAVKRLFVGWGHMGCILLAGSACPAAAGRMRPAAGRAGRPVATPAVPR